MKKFLNLAMLFLVAMLFSCTTQQSELNIEYEKYTLSNGLDVILHVDKSDPIVAFVIQYHVGSNREVTGRTGFAHLFEHMMFQKSENVGEDQFFKLISNAGGTLNGGTSNDATTYFEVVPKNALEMILWMESDRLGYMINTVTQKAFAIQQNVVQNEKRQGVDNRPYGHTGWVIAKNLYPEGHPYNWTVIGEMEDLLSASVQDVKEFHGKFYLPNNATIVLAGDIDVEETKALIEKYFGEIPGGAKVTDPEPIPIVLEKIKKVYHEDNFARASQLQMIWPTVEEYHPDAYPLSYLGQILSQGKKAPFYKILEKEKNLTSRQYSYNRAQEIAGAFYVNVTANKGVSLKDVEENIFEGFKLFEEESFTEEDVERIKAGLEIEFYNGISSILGKSFVLASYNEYAGDPSYYKTDTEFVKAVTKADIIRVYEKYVKGKPYLATSFVPKGQVDMVAEGSVKANVVEENILEATEVEITDTEEEEIAISESLIDRSIQPALGVDPILNIPSVWEAKMDNGMKVYGIEHNELPLVQFNLVIKGGHYLDRLDKAGAASLMATLMMEGTANKTPQELEEAIESLGAYISVRASNNDIVISANTLARNYEAVLDLVEEILLEPRWDEEEFALAKTARINNLIRQKASPNTLARQSFNKLIYGTDHIFSISSLGTEETVSSLTIDDLKDFYNANLSPDIAFLAVAGNVNKEKVIQSIAGLSSKWEAKTVEFPTYNLPAPLKESKIYFVNVPGAKQSVINIGNLGLARNDADFYPAYVMNYQLGGAFNSDVNSVLREEKGYTYGARTGFSGSIIPGAFIASSSVRSTATLESVQIFKDLMTKYRDGISEENLVFTKNALIKSNSRKFETPDALLGMLGNIGTYDLAFDYIKDNEAIVKAMTLDQHKGLAQKYINPLAMYYVIAGDAETQMDQLSKLGFGKPILVE